MRKEKLTQEQKDEKFSRIEYRAISIILWIMGISVATTITSACVYAVYNIIKIMMEG